MAMTLKQITADIGKVPLKETHRRLEQFKKENPDYMESEEFKELQFRKWTSPIPGQLGEYRNKETDDPNQK